MKYLIMRWISFLLIIAISILLVRLFIWLLPIIIGLIIGYYIYCYFKNTLKKEPDIEVEKVSKKRVKKSKNKKIIIIDEEKND